MAQEFLFDKGRAAPQALLEMATLLHGIMLSLHDLQGLALQSVIAKVPATIKSVSSLAERYVPTAKLNDLVCCDRALLRDVKGFPSPSRTRGGFESTPIGLWSLRCCPAVPLLFLEQDL